MEHTVHKLFPDYHVDFGDGGQAELDFPVSCMNSLPIKEETRERLFRHLRAVDRLRNDVQPNGIVHDVTM
jgi:hypothetical protein